MTTSALLFDDRSGVVVQGTRRSVLGVIADARRLGDRMASFRLDDGGDTLVEVDEVVRVLEVAEPVGDLELLECKEGCISICPTRRGVALGIDDPAGCAGMTLSADQARDVAMRLLNAARVASDV